MTYNEKRLNHHFRKTHMEQLNLITNFLGIKDKNIIITNEYDMGTHKELHGYLDYESPKCPACKGQMGKYDFQKASKIPYLECAGYRTLIRLKSAVSSVRSAEKWLSRKLLWSRRITKSQPSSIRKSLNCSLKTVYDRHCQAPCRLYLNRQSQAK